MAVMEQHVSDVKLGHYVRSYLDAFRGNENEQPAQLQTMCSALAGLLGQLLRGNDSWNPYYWVDGIIPAYASAVSRDEVTVQGTMVWADGGNNPMYVEPFSAVVRLSSAGEGVVFCEMKCGDSSSGIGKKRYGSRISTVQPEEWLFVFSTALTD